MEIKDMPDKFFNDCGDQVMIDFICHRFADDIEVCPECGSPFIEYRVWQNINTGRISGDCEDDTFYCMSCDNGENYHFPACKLSDYPETDDSAEKLWTRLSCEVDKARGEVFLLVNKLANENYATQELQIKDLKLLSEITSVWEKQKETFRQYKSACTNKKQKVR